MTQPRAISPLRAWILATRPRTLPAAVAPVLVGTAMAVANKSFKCLPALASRTGALLLQIGVNLANDYFDYVRGIDMIDRLGPLRVTQSGLIAPARVKVAIITALGLSATVGLSLILVAGWPILAIGLASIFALLAYSGGPYPLASHGLGDLFVFIFFGPVAVCGTYYVQTLNLTWPVILVAVPVGFLITAILVVNNLRDIHSDRKAGKHTLAVIIGNRKSKTEYWILAMTTYISLFAFWLTGMASAWVLLPVVSLPLAWSQIRTVMQNSGRILNKALAGPAMLCLLFALLLSAGLILSL